MSLYYVAHRLFSAHDRALAAYTAHRLAQSVGADAVFHGRGRWERFR